MRIEFTQTFEDFREAQEAHLFSSTRPTKPAKVGAMVWQLGAGGLTGVLLSINDPLSPTLSLLHRILSMLFIPFIPWCGILLYSYWFQWKRARSTTPFVAPWKRPMHDTVKPVTKNRARKLLFAAIISIVPAALCIALGIHGYMSADKDSIDLFIVGLGLTLLAWVIWILWAGLMQAGVTSRYTLHTLWDHQTQLRETIILDVRDDGVSLETSNTKSEFKWTAFPGLIETKTVFLLYRSAAVFYIIPKRAFASAEILDAFRNIVIHHAGQQPSAFPVISIPVAAAPT